jgi:very-short-patch-repair endonuclease
MDQQDNRGKSINPKRNRARALRRNATEVERELWWHLRRKLPLDGSHFRRQVPLGPYIADFACLKHRVIIEINGGQHSHDAQVRKDAERTTYLEQQGFLVLRFWNHEMFSEIDSVLETIFLALALTPPPPSPPHKGEGGECA